MYISDKIYPAVNLFVDCFVHFCFDLYFKQGLHHVSNKVKMVGEISFEQHIEESKKYPFSTIYLHQHQCDHTCIAETSGELAASPPRLPCCHSPPPPPISLSLPQSPYISFNSSEAVNSQIHRRK